MKAREKSLLSDKTAKNLLSPLNKIETDFAAHYPGESLDRRPIHTVYGGANLFKANIAQKFGGMAQRAMQEYAPNFAAFAKILGLRGAETLPESPERIIALSSQLQADFSRSSMQDAARLAYTVYHRTMEKLKRESMEDYRIDFEDGYGYRSDVEEDEHARLAAIELGKAMSAGNAPPFIGIRVKPFNSESGRRGIRTINIFVSSLLDATHGRIPPHFCVTLPKVSNSKQVDILADMLDILEKSAGLKSRSIKIEMMMETPQSLINSRGEIALSGLVAAADGRLTSVHFGAYDYAASLGITSSHQQVTHPACDFARNLMQVALAGTGLALVDSPTVILPIPPHRAIEGRTDLTDMQAQENRQTVHRSWKLHYDHVRHSLRQGYYQGWDLHPAQLPVRYAATYAFFLEDLESAAERLKVFLDKASQATRIGAIFDDAATGQGLLNFFIRASGCGALTTSEVQQRIGVTLAEMNQRSFMKIVEAYRNNPSRSTQPTASKQ